jgi:regulator of replication initiation timing
MSLNNPGTAPKNQSTPNNSKNVVIGVLAAGLLVTGGYLFFDKNQSSQTIQKQETQIAKVSDEKSDIQQSFDESLSRLDSLTGANSSLQSKLTERNTEIAKVKKEIRSILNKKNATAAELSRAKKLIATLNGNIENMQQEVARLTQENETLGQEKVALTADKEVLTTEKQKLSADLETTTVAKQDLEKKVDVASTLNASNIAITPINVKGNGKEKVSNTAKRVDKLVISFDVANRIAEPGQTDVYVVVIGPDGKPVSSESLGSGTFTTREEGDKLFTAKLPVEVETAKKKNVQFALNKPEHFQQGNYRIQIYQNGFLIADGTKELKKANLFG